MKCGRKHIRRLKGGVSNWHKTKPCNSWKDFTSEVEAFGPACYRGLNSKRQALESTFDRAISAAGISTEQDYWKYEAAILREFRRRAHHYVSDTPRYSDRLEWLALMRHYGAPSRLVDFTYSPYIAAYFAFSDFGKTPRAIWAVNRDWLSHKFKKRTNSASIQDFHDPKKFTEFFLDPKAKSNSKPLVYPVNPERMNARLTIQQGVFLCTSRIDLSFEDNLKCMVTAESSPPPIVKFVVPHKARNEFLSELKRMNIYNASLFPDLGGLATSLGDRFEVLFKDFDIPEAALKNVVVWDEDSD